MSEACEPDVYGRPLHGTKRCLLCDFQGEFLHWSRSCHVGQTKREECIKCGFITVQVFERVEVPREDLDTVGFAPAPDEPLPQERPMMDWWFSLEESAAADGGEDHRVVTCPECGTPALAVIVVESVGTSEYEDVIGHACTDFSAQRQAWLLFVHPEEADPA